MQLIKQLQDDFRAYLQENRFTQTPQDLYDPINYILSLGGKRLRPVLALLGCHLFRDDYRAALPVAMAVEIFHNFSLRPHI